MEGDYLFKIGDNIVYPMQGAGTITAIEEKEMSGVKQSYYRINLLSNNMQVMIPCERISNIGLRFIEDSNTLDNILNFYDKDIHINKSLTYKERYTVNMNKIKSGELKLNYEVIHDLMVLDGEKSLNSSERQMLNNAKKFLIGEISLIKNISEEEAGNLLYTSVNS